ncbi:single-stranded-DNA-specific exonuclease RecJ [Thermaurantiacus sp.]
MGHPLGVARSFAGRPWVWRADPLPLAGGEETGFAAALLRARGCAEADLERYLKPRLRDWLPDPSAFRDMDAAAARIARAVETGETVAIFADYDVDGATSAAILVRQLSALGLAPRLRIPDRLLEGYGPSAEALLALRSGGATLALVLDCGTQALGPLTSARAAGLDVIVVDHHKASAALPEAVAIVNPNRLDELADNGVAAQHAWLCTAGLAFLLAVAVNRELRRRGWFAGRAEPDLAALLDLVAVGTVADVMPLLGLNRALVALGLRRLDRRENPGLAALLRVAGVERRTTASDIGFHLGPRINAAGRVGTADLGVRLLTTETPGEAEELAGKLDQLNRERRTIEAEVFEAALATVDRGTAVAVASGEGWHPGVIGIVAGRLKERLGRPAIVIATDREGPAKGSGRSVPGVDLGAAVLAAKERGLLLAGGGHAMAAGLTVEPGRIAELSAFLNGELGASVRAHGSERALAIDLAVAPRGLSVELAEALEAAGPYGEGWPAPRVAVGPLRLTEARPVGDGKHVRVVGMGADGARVVALLFRGRQTPAGEALLERPGRMVHLAGRVAVNDWNGRSRVELHLDDAAAAD